MDAELILRWLHVIGATVLLGTGAGIAFFMLMAHLSKNVTAIAHTVSVVVVADTIFTATAAIIQPITGLFLANSVGWPLTEGWIVVSIGLYVFVGLFWLPVVWIQIQIRGLAMHAVENKQELPERYFKLFRIWFACGFPAFFAVLAIFWLMISKPQINLDAYFAYAFSRPNV